MKAPYHDERRQPRKSPAGFRLGLSSLLVIELVNDAKQIIADAAHNDYGRDGPKQQYWHFCLLLSHLALARSTRENYHLFPIRSSVV